MVLQDLGGVIFFTDPLYPVHASNPTTARALIPVLREGADGAERHGQKGAL